MKKNIVAGVGEIGGPILRIISGQCAAAGYDTNPKLCTRQDKYDTLDTEMLHVCIPFSDKFESDVDALCGRFSPEMIVIHGTIPPNTTSRLQGMLSIPVLYSPTRGVHKSMLADIKRYTKYFALESDAPRSRWASTTFAKLMKRCGIRTEKMSRPVTLELAKIITDTSYYGWLINYAQISKIIADRHNVDYDEMWEFAGEIHKHLGNRPKMFPGIIGGHCVLENLKLIDEKSLHKIKQINGTFAESSKKTKPQKGGT